MSLQLGPPVFPSLPARSEAPGSVGMCADCMSETTEQILCTLFVVMLCRKVNTHVWLVSWGGDWPEFWSACDLKAPSSTLLTYQNRFRNLALTMATAWSLFASSISFAFLLVFPERFGTRGVVLMHMVPLYGFCLMFRAVEVYFPEAFSWSLDFFVAGIQIAMLYRQCTVSALLFSDFSVLTKMCRFVLAIGTSNCSHIVIWNVLFAITGIYRGLTLRCGMFAGNAGDQWQQVYMTAFIVVGLELLCSTLILVVWLAMEKFMALFISAILDAQESENEKVAAQRMLAVLCDAQMMLDSELRISGRHESSARFLQVPAIAAAGCESLDGVYFTEFVDPVDVSRFLAFMRGRPSWPSGRPESPQASPDEDCEQRMQDSPPKPAGSLHVQMFNGLRRPFKAELFHVCFTSSGTLAHLVGIREENQNEGETFSSNCEATFQDAHSANETGEASESFAALFLNDLVGQAGEFEERIREEKDKEKEEEEEKNVQETLKSRPSKPVLKKKLLSMRAFETGDLLNLKLGSTASACSSSSASSSCASKALPMFPGLQDVVASLAPFSLGLAMNSCQLNFLSSEGDLCLSLKDFVSAAQLQRILLIVQNMVNCVLNDGLSQQTDIGPLQLKFPGTRECDGLALLVKSAEVSVSVASKDQEPPDSQADPSNEDWSDEDRDGSKGSLESKDGPETESESESESEGDRLSGPEERGGGGGASPAAASFGVRDQRRTQRPTATARSAGPESIRVTLRLRDLSMPAADTSKHSSRRRRRHRVMECLKESSQNVQQAACMFPIIEEACTALAAAAVAAAALERSSLRRCGVAARRLRRRVVALRAANEALMTAEAEVDEEEDLIVENVMGRRTLSLWPGIEDALEDFAGLPIPKRLADAFTERGILKGSPIQEASMSKIKDGKHVIIHSPTGSGKTLAYLLPVLARLQPTMHVGAQVLILVPTPELALQITRELRWLVQVLCGFQGVCWFNPQVPQELACEVLLSRSGLWECIRKDTAIVITTPSIIVSELRSLQWEARKFSETLAYFMGSNMSAVIMDEVDALCPGEVKGRRKQQFGASEQVLDYVFDVVRSRYRNRPVQMVSASATANGKKAASSALCFFFADRVGYVSKQMQTYSSLSGAFRFALEVSRVLERILAKKYVKRRDMAYKLKPELVQQGPVTSRSLSMP
ncbi:unnamed protein product [Polarella glacialis]|uniref:ATP-dependent RNA helicase n=1 Tax=Polarella glacialis TaxID=89957 RepID=A0A813I998_POLGL|nr:unnamed protein product [Polarella glacialis]